VSYDVWATIEPAPDRFSTYLDLGNMTSNVAPMWRAACPSLDGLADIDGKKGAEISDQLNRGLRFMYRQRRKLEELNPPNGWGNYAAAFRYFAAITRAANMHPGATFRVSR
jgi:hypothetical protein